MIIHKALRNIILFELYQGNYKKSFYCKIKELLTQFQHIHDELKDENEIAIGEKYGYDARRYTVGLTSNTIISTFLHICIVIYFFQFIFSKITTYV